MVAERLKRWASVVSYGRNILHNFNYILSGVTLDRTDSIKDLGVIFDSKLKFTIHIDQKSKHSIPEFRYNKT